MSDVIVRLRVGGVVFDVEKEILLKVKGTYFYGLLSSGAWHPDADGAYTIDRPAVGFDRILDYLRSSKLSVEGMSEFEEECLYSSLDYLLIPYRRQWHYTTESVIEGLCADYVCELKDGRLCVAYEEEIDESTSDSEGSESTKSNLYSHRIRVWNMHHTNAVDVTLEGHTNTSRQVIQLHDGRVCSCSSDTTIKLWSIYSGLCELTLTGHTMGVKYILQLLDGRICSCADDGTIKVWNISTGVCEMTMHHQFYVFCIVQLPDGRFVCSEKSTISIYSLVSGACEISWKARSTIRAIVCIDSTRVCSCSFYNQSAELHRTIKVWSTATGECERTLEGHTCLVYSVVLMQDGRLCSGSHDGTLKLWNLETGECEDTLNTSDSCKQMLQLEDGRLLFTYYDKSVVIWS